MSPDTAMDDGPERWISRIAAALCAASRWVVAVAIALTVLAATRLLLIPPGDWLTKLGLALVVALGAVQLYLAVRIELDRRLFQRLAESAGVESRALAELDEAMQALRLQSPDRTGRSLADRAQGVLSLIRRLGLVTAVQLAALVLIVWFD